MKYEESKGAIKISLSTFLLLIAILIILIMGGAIYYLIRTQDNLKEKIEVLDEKEININNNDIQSNNTISENKDIENSNTINNSEKNVQKKNDFKISYKTETFQKSSPNGIVNIKNERNLPIISNSKNEKIAKKITDYLTNVSDRDWNDLSDTSETLMNDIFNNETSNKMNIGVSYLFSTNYITENFVSFMYTCSGNLGQSLWDGFSYYQFDSNTGEILEFDNISLDTNSKENIYNATINYIQQNYNTDEFWNDNSSGYWKNIVKDNMFKTGNWYLTDSEIGFSFGRYLLANGSVGLVNVKLNIEDINQYLKQEYR